MAWRIVSPSVAYIDASILGGVDLEISIFSFGMNILYPVLPDVVREPSVKKSTVAAAETIGMRGGGGSGGGDGL